MEKLKLSKKIVDEKLFRHNGFYNKSKLIRERDISDDEDESNVAVIENKKKEVIEETSINRQDDDEDDGTDVEDDFESDDADEDETADSDDDDKEIHASPIFYKYNKKTYTVDNANFLQRNFSSIDPESTTEMNMCIYKCIQSGCTPYLLYLMVYDEKTKSLIFPKYNISTEIQEESAEETESRVLDHFKQTLFDIYPPAIALNNTEDAVDIYTEELFRGFYVHENNNITMVYDATKIAVPLSDDKEYYWVTPYEMFASKTVHGLSVDPHVIFEIASADGSLDKNFYHLKDVATNELVKDPYVLFLCKPRESSSSILNLFGDSSEFENIEPMDENDSVIQIIYPRINNPKIGTYTFFSSKTNIKGAKRFAVFVDIDGLSPLYIEPVDSDKLNHLYDPENIEASTAITYMNGSQQIWCIKSPYYFSEINEVFIEISHDEKTEDIIGELTDKSAEEPTDKSAKDKKKLPTKD